MIQSILFDRSRWNVNDAKHWLQTHNHKIQKVDITENFLRFRQAKPDRSKYYFTKKMGNGIELIIMN
jgi:hypothetical protein